MTKVQLKQVQKIREAIEELASKLEDFRSEAQSLFDEKSETWQDSDAGQQYEAELDYLAGADDGLQTALEELDNIA